MTHTDGRYVHASGDDESGCVSCQVDALLDGEPMQDVLGCQDAAPDDAEPDLCRVCSHTIERVA